MTTAADAFHAHLDRCRRCREQVWNLCPTGYKLLTEAALSLSPRPA